MAGSQQNSGGNTDRSAGERSRGGGEQNKSDFQASVERLEEAVQELVGSATNEFTDRASSLVDDITRKIQNEFGGSRDRRASGSPSNWRVELGLTADDLGLSGNSVGHDEDYDLYGADDYSEDDYSDGRSRRGGSARRMRERRRQRRRRMPHDGVRSSRLYRDTKHAKIGGVCAGLANYYGMETWVVRCLAVTGLLFMGQIVFPAYWIAYFVMDTPQKVEARRRPGNHRRRDRRSAGEPQRVVAPGQTLRNVELDMNQAELRLRRIESHVTSGHYELQKELNRIDPKSPVNGNDHTGDGSK